MSENDRKYGHMAGLPEAAIAWRHGSGTTNSTCEVLVGGEPVAVLAATGFEYTQPRMGQMPHVKLELLAGDVLIESLDTARLRNDLRTRDERNREVSGK